MRSPYIVSLQPDEVAPIELVGGKGHNLLRLISAGMPVPGGFVITTAAYRAWTSGKNKLPLHISHELRRAYDALGKNALVAVRSSGTSEDLAGASFAGGHETTLNVSGWTSVLDAIRSCWASLYSDRARAYRAGMNVGEDGLAIAVVVQKMVDARTSGVVFTAEPVTGDRNTIAIDACPGLGEDLVSGKVIPEHHELSRKRLAVTKQENKAGCLSKAELKTIARRALDIERCFACPQDIEWSIDTDGSLQILQSRPITTSSEWTTPVPGAIWVRSGGGGLPEYLPTAVSPLYATAQLPRIVKLLDVQCVENGVVTPDPTMTIINGHCYSRQDYRLGPGAVMLPFNYWSVGRSAARRWTKDVLPKQTAALAELRAFDRAVSTDAELLAHLERALDFNAAAWDNAVRASRAWVVIEPVFNRFARRYAASDGVIFLRGFMSEVLAGERELYLLAQAALSSATVARVIRNADGDDALRELPRTAEGREWLGQLLTYCERYGHMAPTQDYLHASAADDPQKALAAVRSRLDLPAADPIDRLQEVAAKRADAEEKALDSMRHRPVRRAIFSWILRLAQAGASIRENVFFHALSGWPLARRDMMELGARLTRRGSLTSAEDVFFLEWNELTALVRGETVPEVSRLVSERKIEYARQAELAPPAAIPAGGAPLTVARRIKNVLKRAVVGSSRESGRDFLRGSPVSPGRVTGPARILLSVADFGTLQAGDIVVTRAATPDWTPTFTIAAAFVTDTGGPLSHCSIIAREFGIPSVMGVQRATQRIREGQIITVDGAEGVIRLHSEEGKQ